MRAKWITGLCLAATFTWLGCTTPISQGPSTAKVEVTQTIVEATPLRAVEEPTTIAAPLTANEEPTAVPTATSGPKTTESPAPAPTATSVPEATPPASAEGPSMPASIRTAPVNAQEPLPPIPVHPFRPAAGRQRIVVLDPGHGGGEVGAAGAGLAEKSVNLDIALRLKKLLEADGMRVVLTREKDERAYVPPEDQSPSGNSITRMDLQARMDLANQLQADVFISIHNNGSADPGQAGTEVWWDGKRPFGAYNEALANDALSSLVEAIRQTGYPVANRGAKEDSNFRTYQGRAFPIFVLGPPRTGSSTTRATQMPAILGETLFLSNPIEAQQLRREEVMAAIAGGYRAGIMRYFARIDAGELALPPEGLPVERPNYYVLTPSAPPTGEQR